jgi:hypothetical protein
VCPNLSWIVRLQIKMYSSCFVKSKLRGRKRASTTTSASASAASDSAASSGVLPPAQSGTDILALAEQAGDSSAADQKKRARPSSYEKALPHIPESPAWRGGLNSWPSVLLTVAFFALLERNTKRSWQDAIELVAHAQPPAKVDLALLPPCQTGNRKSPLHLFWRIAGEAGWKLRGDASTSPPSTVIAEMFKTIKSIGIPTGMDMLWSELGIAGECGDMTPLRRQAGRSTFPKWKECVALFSIDGTEKCDQCGAASHRSTDENGEAESRHRLLNFAHRCNLSGHVKAFQQLAIPSVRDISADKSGHDSKILQIRASISDPDKLYDIINLDGFPLSSALITLRSSRLFLIELLRCLPVLELDVYLHVDQDWKQPESYTGSADAEIAVLFEAGRTFMTLYRRERSLVLRALLSDVIPYDMFGIIDAYGALPVIRPPSDDPYRNRTSCCPTAPSESTWQPSRVARAIIDLEYPRDWASTPQLGPVAKQITRRTLTNLALPTERRLLNREQKSKFNHLRVSCRCADRLIVVVFG